MAALPGGAVLVTPQAAWLWAITAVVIIELLVGAAMAAAILASAPVADVPTTATPSLLARVSEALVSKLEAAVTAPDPEQATLHPHRGNGASAPPPTSHPAKQQVLETMLAIYQHNPQASLRLVGQQIGRTPQTVSNYLTELERQGRVRVNPQGVQVVV